MPASRNPMSRTAFISAVAWMLGIHRKATSGLASLMRCTNGAKSGFCGGKRTAPTIWPPPSVKPLVKEASESCPGMKSLTAV